MVQRVGDRTFLTDAAAGSLADARSELARSLVGRARVLNELVDGRSMVADEAAALPPNPQGLVGLDMSGPPWGSAWRHPVCWFGGRGTDVSTVQQRAKHTPLIHVAADAPAALGPWQVWVRPFEALPAPFVAPYAALYMWLRARVRTGTATLTITVSVADDEDMQGARTASTTVALTTTMTTFQPGILALVDEDGRRFITIEVSTSAGTAEVECGAFGVLDKRGT